MDAGDILAIRKTSIPLEMTAGELMDVLADLGKVALWEVLQSFEKGTLRAIKQDPTQVSFAKKLTVEDAKVDWTRSCEAVHNQIRGVNPNPGAWCKVEIKGEKKRLLIKKALPCHSLNGLPGEILSRTPNELIIGCERGGIAILEMQLEGKKTMRADAFLRGTSLDRIKFLE